MKTSDLSTKGYCVIPDFLDQTEINLFKQRYKTLPQDTNKNFYASQPPRDLLEKISHKIETILRLVNQTTDLKVDLVLPIGFYADTTKLKTSWHQDHESFFFFQQTYHYLNFYVMLEKTDPNKSGLSVIPFDKLIEADTSCKNFINSGARTFYAKGPSTVVFNQEDGKLHSISANFSELEYTPTLNPGDLFLIRGDVIHKTQDSDSYRLAVSIRCTRSDKEIRLEPFVNPTRTKLDYINNNFKPYDNLIKTLQDKKSITAEEAVGSTKILQITL